MYSTSYLLLQATIAVAIGDALGVPVQFSDRQTLLKNPITQMTGYGDFNVPKGTWSDDTSLTLATLASLSNGFNLNDMMMRYRQWYDFGDYTPFGESFDIGETTKNAIERYKHGVPPEKCGGDQEYDNGNGTLMRVMPLAFYLLSQFPTYKFNQQVAKICEQFSSLTHRHPRSIIATAVLVNVTTTVILSPNKYAMLKSIREVLDYYENIPVFNEEIKYFDQMDNPTHYRKQSAEVQSSGYIIDTLNSVFWCLMNSEKYVSAVKKAVNLGNDADTIASITSMLGSLLYAPVSFPPEWIEPLRGRIHINWNVAMALQTPYF
ncbi:ADP-ribosylglycohydrolase family protein [Lentilactobacillus sp. SPB1-3]|uniref:ADP-ribosylglycohydrolase family protein n=1 Tax=Lentilactobacillus terminaliae TaxID=3003483 RepID=A0ACD5DDU0_9LACO|nr:ADP-ribosylglycohydrolase family protein [Lentilactobacillus sp. SPB1-3]MCZ0977852.1 ADP-ribosylglycohydrolase family protein [Lentilactobacillus sp. SPB1-3]